LYRILRQESGTIKEGNHCRFSLHIVVDINIKEKDMRIFEDMEKMFSVNIKKGA
jgi:thiamine phosphate synthase YjbQ (UPF0047 family)